MPMPDSARIILATPLPRKERIVSSPLVWLVGLFSFQNVYAVQRLHGVDILEREESHQPHQRAGHDALFARKGSRENDTGAIGHRHTLARRPRSRPILFSPRIDTLRIPKT